MEEERIEHFLRDAADFCANLRRAFKGLESDPDDRDLVHQAFRHVHSLKSESQLLGLDELGAIAHEMEGVLEQIRRGELAPDGDSLGILFPMLDAFSQGLTGLSRPAKAASGDGAVGLDTDEDSVLAASEGPIPVGAGANNIPHFSEFERELIHEARGRGERFYRLTCEIEESAPLKYPKAYLVVNNLEVETNVIRTVPTFETTDDDAFRLFNVYFTASQDADQIRSATDVDQVKSVELTEIAFRHLEEAGEVVATSAPSGARRGPTSMRIENGRLDEVQQRLWEIEETVGQLQRSGAGSSGKQVSTGSIEKLAESVPEVSRLVTAARSVPIADELRHLPWLVQDLATKLGKRVRLHIAGGDVTADRRLASMLSEPLVHLVRNAIDHGIESPEERVAHGKSPEGLVLIAAVHRGGELVLQVGDDGKGISEEAVAARAAELGFGVVSEEVEPFVADPRLDEPVRSPVAGRMLTMLVRPGFSTRTEPTTVSGRGVGLDAIHQKVHFALGGELRLQSQVGRGTVFTISLPGADTMMSVLMVRAARETIGIPARDIKAVIEVDSSSFERGTDGHMFFGAYPVQGARGRADRSDLAEESQSLIIVKGKVGEIAFMCDETLFEREVLEARMSLGEEVGGGLRRVQIGEVEADFLYLDVAAIE